MTETAKFDPAPWRVVDLGDKHFVETNHRYGIENDFDTCQVAKVEGWGVQSEATARLIAAAPDLLAACEAVVEDGYETCGPNDDWPLSFVCEKKVINQLQAAIAKATGAPNA